MALSQKALQRKREKKKQVRQVKKTTSISSAQNSVTPSTWPIYECRVPSTLWEIGMGHVVISRKSSQGDVAVGLYLIDIFCLGIKDCFIRMTDIIGYRELVQQISMNGGELELVDPIYANTLIHKIKKYAMQLGFKPHSDFAKAQKMLKDIPIDEAQEFVFGKDGNPLYIPGPNESAADERRIMRTLVTHSEQENDERMLSLTVED